MANFKIAEILTGLHEGGYANNSADRGGETYAGIARKFWPNWHGWQIIDHIKATKGKTASIINAEAKKDIGLHQLIFDFYKQNFWDVNHLDLFHDQQIANNVYDFGVNAGVKTAAKLLQNVLKLKEDGIIGNMTLNTVNLGNFKAVHDAYNCHRAEYYKKLAQEPSQKQFLSGWLKRLKPYK